MSEQGINIGEYGNLGLNDDQLDKASGGRSKLQTGAYYRFIVTAGPFVDIHETSGNMQLVLPVAPLDENDNVRKPTFRYYITLPWTTPEQALTDKGLPADLQASNKNGGAPNTLFLCTTYLRGVHGEDKYPKSPYFNKDLGHHVFKGEEIDRENAEKIRKELSRTVDNDFAVLCGNPESFVGDTFWATVEDQEDSDFQRIVVDVRSGIVPKAELDDNDVVGTF